MIIVKWDVLCGKHYEGILIDTDMETGIVRLPNGEQVAMNLERNITENGKVIIDNITTFEV